MDDVVTSTPALAPGAAAAGVRATLDCDDIHALPARLGTLAPFLPQIAWSDSSAGGERWLALGEIDSLVAPAGSGFVAAYELLARARERVRLLARLAPEPGLVRYIGGVAFDPRHGANEGWPGGQAARFVLPRVLLRQAGARAEVTVLGTPEAEAHDIVGRLREAARQAAPAPNRIRVREAIAEGSRERWTHAVQEALRAIDSGAVRKVVLARDILLDAEREIDPWALHRLVHAGEPHGLRFCLRFEAGSAFMGASPERLVAQHGAAISCDCLAGTIARGLSPGDEARNAAALLASEKDGREHRIVLEEILAAIAPHVRSVQSPEAPRILALPGVLHLWSPIRAQLRQGVGLSEIVAGLHPTPAVGGSPRLAAMDLIHALEGRSRGWYAGLVGWIGADAADFAVAIRSGIVRGNRMTAFGGAGIVRGSDPGAEWDETARKAASFIHLFSERA
ncbi:MAG: isochorismate synthase [Burkholderiales bacterium]|nr:isochorismate synthase [Burkholderiales bacterium]